MWQFSCFVFFFLVRNRCFFYLRKVKQQAKVPTTAVKGHWAGIVCLLVIAWTIVFHVPQWFHLPEVMLVTPWPLQKEILDQTDLLVLLFGTVLLVFMQTQVHDFISISGAAIHFLASGHAAINTFINRFFPAPTWKNAHKNYYIEAATQVKHRITKKIQLISKVRKHRD